MYGADILARVRIAMNDTTSTQRTPDTDLLNWLNDGISYIASLRPDSMTISGAQTLVSGTRQSLSDFVPKGQRLLDVYRSGNQAVRNIDRNELDSMNPTWHGDTQAATITNFVYDDRDSSTFWVYPPAASGASIDCLYVPVVTPITLATVAQKLGLADAYIDCVTNYVLSRGYMKDSEDDAYLQLAMFYRKQCDDFLGQKNRTDLAFSPDTNSPGGVINKSAAVGGI